MVEILVARFYEEAKAQRVNHFQHIFQERLNALLKTRTKREQELQTELREIGCAYVDLKCRECNKLIRVKFPDWQKGKFKRVCLDCTKNGEHKVLNELHKKIEPFLPDGYEIKYDSYYNSSQILAIRKKK